MTKNESFDHRFFEKIEDYLDRCNSLKFYKFLDYSSENFDLLREVTNETSVELDEVHESLYFLQIDRTLSIDDDFDFLRIHAKIID